MYRHIKSALFQRQNGAHSVFDDVQGILTGLFFLALGIIFLKSAGLYAGGVAGLSLTAHYWLDINVGLAFTLINAPFYILSFFTMGKEFTYKSIVTVCLLSGFLAILPDYIIIASINTYVAAVASGLLIGVGIVLVFRHKGSVGGFGILIMYLQKRKGWNAGIVQMCMDFVVICLSLLSGSTEIVVASLLSALMANFVISVNHRPGRYITF